MNEAAERDVIIVPSSRTGETRNAEHEAPAAASVMVVDDDVANDENNPDEGTAAEPTRRVSCDMLLLFVIVIIVTCLHPAANRSNATYMRWQRAEQRTDSESNGRAENEGEVAEKEDEGEGDGDEKEGDREERIENDGEAKEGEERDADKEAAAKLSPFNDNALRRPKQRETKSKQVSQLQEN